MANEASKYFNRVYVKVINHRTGEDITSRSTVVVLYNGAIYNTRPSPNGPNMYDILEFPYTPTSPIDVTCGATCEGYSQNGVPSKTVGNYFSSLTLTVIDIKQNIYETNIEGNITRISDAKFDIKEAINDRGGNLTEEKIDQYATAADSALKTRFNECNYDYNGVADDEGLKALGWNDLDIAYFKYNNLHAKSEDTGETYNVTAANKEIKITSLADIAKYKNNADFKFCPKFDVGKTTWANNVFTSCTNLIAIPMIDTSNVNLSGTIFNGCTKLITIPPLNTSKSTDMRWAFSECRSLERIPLLDISNVTNTSSMFQNCKKLVSVPQLNTSKVTTANRMFFGCSSLTTIPKLDMKNAINIGETFSGCTNLTSISIEISKVTTMDYTFGYCHKLYSLPAKLNTSLVTNMNHAFYGCKSLKSIPEMDTSNVTNMSYTFSNCESVTELPVLNTGKATNMYGTCTGCYKLKAFPLWNTSSVKNMDMMFYSCDVMTTIAKIDTSKATNMSNTFRYCGKLKDIPELDFSSLTKCEFIFGSCPSLTNLGGFTGLKAALDLYQSPKLTHDSLMNVINKAADVTSSSKKLTIGSTNLKKLSDAEKKIATDKGWILL